MPEHDRWTDVVEGIEGALRMVAAFLTPWLRAERERWGLSEADAARALPGDELVPEARWSWTHGIDVDAPVEALWPWVAQIGGTRGGFYSYQWLENVVGCGLENADRVHPEWQDVRVGDGLVLHPAMPPLPVRAVQPGRWWVAAGCQDLDHPDRDVPPGERPPRFLHVSWLFLAEPRDGGGSRFVSRYRTAYSDDLATRLLAAPALIEAIGFAMDRRMCLGIKARAERPAAG